MATRLDLEDSPPNLVHPRVEAFNSIKIQIDRGAEIRIRRIKTEKDLIDALDERAKWSRYTEELLTRLFDNPLFAIEFREEVKSNSRLPFNEIMIKGFRNRMRSGVLYLDSLVARLELIPELKDYESGANRGSDIFVVHGHDEGAKEAVSRFIEKLGLKVIILHEQPNAGKTIIEKFESYSNVGFAVVLLTPDDVGASREKSNKLKPRARQNVIFELGYFIGKLKRNRVCALYKQEIDIIADLSDFHGILLLPMDKYGAWQRKLAEEINQVGIKVDMSVVL